MTFLRCGLKSCTHTNTKHDIEPRCTMVKQGSYDGVIYLLIHRIATHVKIKMSIYDHGSLDEFYLVHAKLLENTMCILGLANKGHIFKLLDLKSNKELQLSHHRHLKPIGHDLTKLIIKRLISRIKYYVININLTNEQTLANLSSEEGRIDFANFKTVMSEKIPKAFIPCSRSLLNPIEHLMELEYIIRIFLIFIAQWLLHIDFLLDRLIQECAFQINLI
jgi:hypothetical protein